MSSGTPTTQKDLLDNVTPRGIRPRTNREFKCEKCGANCTQGTDEKDEYGHAPKCPDRPDHYRPFGETDDGS